MRTAKACKQCREGKRRCTQPSSNDVLSCLQCSERSLPCSKAQITRRNPTIAPLSPHLNQSTHSDESEWPLPKRLSEELVDLYLHHIHGRPHSLFHPSTLREDVHNRRVGQALLSALCSIGCRFSKNIETCRMTCLLLQQSKSRLLSSLEDDISLENIQACILVANVFAGEGSSRSEALFFGMATRMAQILRINETCPEDTLIMRETKLRTWWTLFMADQWCSSGLGIPRQMNALNMYIDLPMDEHAFENATTEIFVSPGARTLGLWAYMIKLADIFGPIQDLSRAIASSSINSHTIEQQVKGLAGRLQSWENQLPTQMELTPSNLRCFQSKGLGGAFVALHLGYHHYATLLYFRYLDGSTNESEKNYRNLCKHHSFSYSALLKYARSEDNCEVVYPTVGHMALVSTAVLLYTLLSGDDESEMSTARDHLFTNFEAIIELSKYWPKVVTNMIDRLYTFQESCSLSLQSATSPLESHTHQLDNWMVRFLLEHHLPLEKKSILVQQKTAAEQLTDFYSDTFNTLLTFT